MISPWYYAIVIFIIALLFILFFVLFLIVAIVGKTPLTNAVKNLKVLFPQT